MKTRFANDLIASLVVFLVALPLCMGIAIASGLPPMLGIATGVIGGVVVGCVSGAPLQVSGPAAGLAVIVFEIVHRFGPAGLGVIVLGAGLLQFLAGRLKLGQYFRAISPAVVYGMLAGIGLLIVAGQIHVMIDSKSRPNGLENMLAIPEAILKAIFPPEGSSHHIAASIGVLTFAAIALWNKFRTARLKAIPGTLVGVLLGTAVTAALQLEIKHVQIPQQIWSALTFPNGHTLSGLMDVRVLLSVLTVALIASAETLLSAAAVDRMHSGIKADLDKELAAQGIGNMLCGLLGSLPMTGVIVRSSANVQAGAQTRLSTIMHGIWLLALVLMCPGLLRTIPMASLAAVLVFTGMKLVDVKHVQKLRRYGVAPVFTYLATTIGVVAVDLLTGVLIGLALSAVQVVWSATHLRIEMDASEERQRTDLTLKGLATFVRLPLLARALDSIPDHYRVYVHVVDLHHIDHTCLDLLKAAADRRSQAGGSLEVQWAELDKKYRMTHLVETPDVSPV